MQEQKWKKGFTKVLEDDEIFKYVKPTFTTNELYSVFNKIMKPVFPHMDRHKTKTYFHLRFDNSDMGLRKFFNSVSKPNYKIEKHFKIILMFSFDYQEDYLCLRF